MIGPSKINNGGITFTLFAHTYREYGSTLAQECGKPQTSFCSFLAQCQKPPPHGAGGFRAKAARRRVNEDSYGDVVRHLKG